MKAALWYSAKQNKVLDYKLWKFICGKPNIYYTEATDINETPISKFDDFVFVGVSDNFPYDCYFKKKIGKCIRNIKGRHLDEFNVFDFMRHGYGCNNW